MNPVIKDPRKLVNLHYMYRSDVVPFYAGLIICGSEVETKRVNDLILSKWTPSGLNHIKERAWAIEIKGKSLYDHWLDDTISKLDITDFL